MKGFNIGDLRIPVPIIQGGMGIGISLSGLASAVANMGGIGVISTVGIGFIEDSSSVNLKNKHIDAIRREIRKAREKTKGILGVNIMSVITNFADMVRTSIDEGIDIIFSGAGLPLDLPKYLGEGIKTKLVPIVSSGRAASVLCAKWKQNFNYLPDALVVEGPKAGGHLGFKPDAIDDEDQSLEFLVAEVLEVARDIKSKYDKDIPVIAAGGIYSGDDMYHIMEKGAAAVQLGTRFVATEECDASIDFKKAFIAAVDDDIRIIKSPVGLPGRTIGNRFLDDASAGLRRPEICKYNCIKTCNPKTTSYCIADALLAAYHGNMNDGFAFTGANAGKVDRISTVKQVFEDLISEFKKRQNIFQS
ncbi:NAD(P)H-dependent flavin oxidoreductase [Saccharicrinis sp. FJH54]|uniref:NAD(P)H-dependent flavin oxidoreductase n=1 Tax=Saccharicrinis sp. FJH54 TaxID=3344665 RepID=UPI0035D4DDF2